MEKWELNWTNLIEFNLANVNTLDDNISGVYRLSFKHDDGKIYVFYVGESENIKDKLLEHLSPSESNTWIKGYRAARECFCKYAQVSNIEVRKSAVKQMFKHYEPVGNEKEPEGRTDISINFS